MKDMVGYDVADVLHRLGLARRRSISQAVLPAMGLVAVGALVGAGVSLVFAPSSGRRFRQELSDRIGQARERVRSTRRGASANAASLPG